MQKHTNRTSGEQVSDAEAPKATVSKVAKEINEKLDAMLDEIDDILEQNAEEFVAGYVQKGGE